MSSLSSPEKGIQIGDMSVREVEPSRASQTEVDEDGVVKGLPKWEAVAIVIIGIILAVGVLITVYGPKVPIR